MTPTNRFSHKMVSKSSDELKWIIEPESEFVEEARQAAQWELEKREADGTLKREQESGLQSQTGEAQYRYFLQSIVRENCYGWPPRFFESFETNVKYELIHQAVIKTFERLEWDVVYQEVNYVEAIRRSETDSWREKIKVKINPPGEVEVTSSSFPGEWRDDGRNSKRVKLFIHVFRKLEHEFDK